MESFWQLEDELCGKLKGSDDHQWSMASSKLAEITKRNNQRTNNLNLLKGLQETTSFEKHISDDNKISSFSVSPFGSNFRQLNDSIEKGTNQKNYFGNSMDVKSSCNKEHLLTMKLSSAKINNITSKYGNMEVSREVSDGNNHVTSGSSNGDKRFKALSVTEMLPRNVALGGYIFVCNNDTMQEDLKRHLFGLPPRYRDSVRAITPGLPLFLYNYTTHQLHGIFEAASFGGSSIDPTAWEDKKCKGGSRFPAQVRIRIRKVCNPLEEDSFRPVLHHYDGPKFRLELSIPETLQLLDLCEQGSF